MSVTFNTRQVKEWVMPVAAIMTGTALCTYIATIYDPNSFSPTSFSDLSKNFGFIAGTTVMTAGVCTIKQLWSRASMLSNSHSVLQPYPPNDMV